MNAVPTEAWDLNLFTAGPDAEILTSDDYTVSFMGVLDQSGLRDSLPSSIQLVNRFVHHTWSGLYHCTAAH